jgi:hypothetical protein
MPILRKVHTADIIEKEIYNQAPYMFDWAFNGHDNNEPICYGIECGKGWHPIIADLVKALNRADYFKCIRVEQIKEKFGGFRFYFTLKMHPIIEKIPLIHKLIYKILISRFYNIISKYEKIIESTCEICGSSDSTLCKRQGWLKTVCLACQKKEKYSKTSMPKATSF